MSIEPEELGFEEALAELEAIVSELEGGNMSLEASLELFERGQMLADYCNRQLQSATLRVEQLTEHGEIVDVEV